MPNIKFHYLYRDGANYKNFKSVIFGNDVSINLEDLETLIKSKLVFGEWFYVDQWKLPDLHFGTWDNMIDHTFHEFESVENTDESPNATITLREFINAIEQSR